MPSMTSTLAIRLLDGVSGPAKGAAGSLGAIAKATDALSKVRGLRDQTARLDEMVAAHKRAKESIRGLASQLIATDAPAAKMKAAYERATAAADRLGTKIDWQRARVRAASSALDQMGVSARNLSGAEASLRANIEKTSAAIRRQQAVAERRARAAPIVGAAIAGAGYRASSTGRNLAVRAVERAGDLDLAKRKQVAFAGISQADQDRILAPQAKRIAYDTRFSVTDATTAQTAAMQGLPDHLPKAAVAAELTKSASYYSQAMGSDLTTGAEALRAYLASAKMAMDTQEAAAKSATHASNMLIKMSKLGGMDDNDARGFVKFGIPASQAAGLSEQNALATGIALRRGGVAGDEAGVFLRALSSRLVAPTRKGIAGLQAGGIDYNSYSKMPGGLSTDNLAGKLRTDLGLKLTDATRKAIDAINEDDEIVSDRGRYAAAIRDALEEQSGGKMSAKDSQAIARSAGEFHKLSVASVDVNRLYEDMQRAGLTLAQLTAIFGDKQAGRAAIAMGNGKNFASDKASLAATPDDYGKKIADDIMAGLGGSIERFKGAVEATIVSVGEANSGLAKFALDGVGGLLDKFTSLSAASQQTATAIGALAAGGTTLYGGVKLLKGVSAFMTGGGSGAALNASALALDGSAAALTAAATRLGAAGVVGSAGIAGGTAAGSAAGIAAGITAAGVAAAGGIVAAFGIIANDYKPAAAGVTKQNAAPGQEHDDGRRRMRAVNEAARQRILETRREVEALGDTGASAGAEAGGKAGTGIAEALAGKKGEVAASSRSLMETMKSIFGAGISVPIHMQAPAASPGKPAGDKTSSLSPSIRNNITIHTGSGDPSEIARQVSAKVAESSKASLRGAFSDNA